jgi:competence protein ComEC
VLKVAHHGSRTSTTPAFLRAVAPRWALVSAGGRFGHPAAEIVERLVDSGAEVKRTDQGGALVVDIDRAGIRVRALLDDQAGPGGSRVAPGPGRVQATLEGTPPGSRAAGQR